MFFPLRREHYRRKKAIGTRIVQEREIVGTLLCTPESVVREGLSQSPGAHNACGDTDLLGLVWDLT